MPAKTLRRADEEGIYLHIYNKGVEKRIIFNDEEDYEVFLRFLEDYLTPKKDPASLKQDFKVHGRTFRGTPHLPKNYFNEVELIAYSLLQDQFHLLLRQLKKGSVESFIRSLCTRYSMYFNKKYERTGTLFEGPYKSNQLKDESSALKLTYHLHTAGNYSSYHEYLGSRETSWVKPQVILSSFNEKSDYKAAVEKYKPDQQDMKYNQEHLERRDPATLKLRSTAPDILAISFAMFLLLVSVGIGNIQLTRIRSFQPSQSPTVLSETKELVPETQAKPQTVRVKTDYQLSGVNIRQEPSASSEKIGQAKSGDTFELISRQLEWLEIKLASGSAGFISGEFMEEITDD